MIKRTVTGIVFVLATASFATAAVGVDVSTPNVRVQVGTPAAPPVIVAPAPPVRVIERERVIIEDRDHHDNGKHKGNYKKHKKHKKHRD